MEINNTEINEEDESVGSIDSDDTYDPNDSTEEEEEEESSITTDLADPIQKKRGRKCKPKDDNDDKDNNELTEKIQKKRGRKPKVKDITDCEKIPKKRGRKPKEKVYSVKELPKTFFEENKNETFILHLPIKISDNNNNPLPNSKNDYSYSIYDEDLNNYKINDNNLLPTQTNLLSELSNTYSANLTNLSFDKDEPETKPNKMNKKNLKNIMYEFISANNDKTWPETTNIYCWWCCHPFKGSPCALPEYYKKEKFYVNGCFCSFNCTASYNFSKNDDDIWERYSLLNLMYKKLYNYKFIKINLAPPREILKIFGGYLSIEEFRENSLKSEKTFSIINPPLISIIPKIEENIINTNTNANKTYKNNFPNVNENILNKTQNNLKLKRTKPVQNPNNTLQSFMDLKIV
jgi:hypothetical protein